MRRRRMLQRSLIETYPTPEAACGCKCFPIAGEGISVSRFSGDDDVRPCVQAACLVALKESVGHDIKIRHELPARWCVDPDCYVRRGLRADVCSKLLTCAHRVADVQRTTQIDMEDNEVECRILP